MVEGVVLGTVSALATIVEPIALGVLGASVPFAVVLLILLVVVLISVTVSITIVAAPFVAGGFVWAGLDVLLADVGVLGVSVG